MADWDVVSSAPAQAAVSDWAVKAEAPARSDLGNVAHGMLGGLELLGAGAGNILPNAANAVIDIGSRALGFGPRSPVPTFKVGQAGQDVITAARSFMPGTANGLDISDTELRQLDPTGKVPIEQLRARYAQESSKSIPEMLKDSGTVAGDIAGNTLQVGGDVANATPLVAARSVPALLRSAAPATAEEALSKAALKSPRSMGAAAAAPSLQNVSPELKQEIAAAAQQTGGAVNADTLSRHIQADTLPVRIKLTEGQASQDPVLLSDEQNLRARRPAITERLNQQDQQLKDNLQAIRDDVGPDVFTTNDAEHGKAVMDAYRAADATAQKAIGQKYQALRDANGGQFPLDAQQLWRNVQADLHQKLLYGHAPAPEMVALREAANGGGLTFEQFENLRTNLARTMRSAADGNTRAAAGVIRDAMEKLPMKESTASGSAQTMLADVDKTFPVNPENPAQRIIDVNGNKVAVELTRDPFDPQAVHLENIKAQTTGQGAGPTALQAVTKLADKHGVRMTLDASPALPTMSTDTLTQSYGRSGFKTVSMGPGDVPAMERLPAKTAGGAQLKALADNARAAARTRFQAIEADPAYKSVVQGRIKPENFLRNYVLNGTPDQVAAVAKLAQQSPALKQTMAVAVTDYLKRAALPSGEGGSFSAAGYNRALNKLSPALKSLVDAKTAEQLQNIGDVARYVKGQPAGSFVNNSNTFTAAAGQLASGALEHAANAVIPFSGTVTRAGRAVFKGLAESRAAERALRPGAGLRNLISDSGRPAGAAPVGYRNQLAGALQ